MIGEDQLRDLLTRAADEIVVPPDGAVQILGLRNAQDRRRKVPPQRPPRRHRLAFLAAAAACVVVIFAAVFVFATGGDTSRTERLAARPPLSNVVAGGSETAGGSSAGGAATNELQPLKQFGGAQSTAGAAPAVPGAGTLTRVVKTGAIDLEISKGGFATATSRLSSLATGAGGFVTASNTVESGDAPTGNVTLRIPVAAFDNVLVQVRSLGRVLQVSSKGEDVTAQYVDLDARIIALTASRQQYEALLRKATSIADTLNVQQRITDLQTQIEQLQGQQRVLQDHSDLATLDVHLSPPGAALKSTASRPQTGMAKAWHRATVRFGDGVESAVAASGTIAFLLLLAAVFFVMGRVAWQLFRRRMI